MFGDFEIRELPLSLTATKRKWNHFCFHKDFVWRTLTGISASSA